MSTRLKLVYFREQQKTWNELKWPVKVIGWPPKAVGSILNLFSCIGFYLVCSSQTPNLLPCVLNQPLTKESDDFDL